MNSEDSNMCKHKSVPVALKFHAVYGPPVDICMNSFLDGKWNQEEKANIDGLTLPSSFRLTLLVEEIGFKIAIDGKHLYDFKHRCPIKLISIIFKLLNCFRLNLII